MPSRQNKENHAPSPVNPGQPSILEATRRQLLGKRKERSDANENCDHSDDEDNNECDIGPQRKIAKTSKLVSYGRHFGRTVHTFCNLQALITEGQNRINELTLRGVGPEHLSPIEQRDHLIFNKLVNMIPELEDQLWHENTTAEDKKHIADMVQKGVKGARADDTKGLKSALVDLVTPLNGVLRPPLSRGNKNGRGFLHEETGRYLCPTDYEWSDQSVKQKLRLGELIPTPDQWPIFLYEGLKFNPEDPWEGLLKGHLMVQAFKYIFTSPSSVDGDARATRSGNAALHGMKRVTTASLVYIATLVRFSLSNSAAFTLHDKVMNHEAFYQGLLAFLSDPHEKDEVNKLLTWWNELIFPGQSVVGPRRVPRTSALASLQERRQKILRAKSQVAEQRSLS
ncbi:hypothetical protein EST38_g12348 [Candolleomyces aberdarensis]|uniref:Uncharacterized protein n=1 Tax=Candolleomyces aberdarensis TaxID=2316362 RepID=A0A4Q2D2L5_9AGAR|nr:hypothetical protein EST38_g12348 [Candolleomyces aberdarensis]